MLEGFVGDAGEGFGEGDFGGGSLGRGVHVGVARGRAGEVEFVGVVHGGPGIPLR